MNLKDYLSIDSLNKADFARRVGVSPAMAYQWSVGLRPVSPKYCHKIEAETEGKVTLQELRPEDWQLLWPELVHKRAGKKKGS